MRASLLLAGTGLLLAAGYAHASRGGDAVALAEAQAEAAAATERYERLERQAQRATGAAERARAAREALAARLEAAEAGLTAAERRIAILEARHAEQRARLAERQGPLIRLTAALQTMARRPPALALAQPGSVRETARVRSLLAATLPEIRRRTAAVRAQVERSFALRRRVEQARAALLASRHELQQRRIALANFEAQQRTRSEQLAGLALEQSDRALLFGEEARALARLINTREYQSRLAADLAGLPGPVPRPYNSTSPSPRPRLAYSLPVEGRLVVGVGEISDGGVHSRGLTFATAAGALVVAPAAGRVAYAAPFRSYGNVIILDHGSGWTTVITNLAALETARGRAVRPGALLGRAGTRSPRVTIELRREGRPVPLAQLVAR